MLQRIEGGDEMSVKANMRVRVEMLQKGIKNQDLARHLKVGDHVISGMLKYELSDDMQDKLIEI